MGKVVPHVCPTSKYHNFVLYEWVATNARWNLTIVRRPEEGSEGWVRLPIRWTVERTFAWLGKCRRLSKDARAECAFVGGVRPEVGHDSPHAQSATSQRE